MPRFISFVGVLFMLVTINPGYAAADPGSDTMISTLRTNLMAWYSRSAPVAGTIEHYIRTLDSNGAWPDVDYTSTDRGGWLTRHHLLRIFDMAKAYTKPGHTLEGDRQLRIAVERALTHWIREGYTNANWWYPRIGIPITVAPTLILMGDEIDPELRQHAIMQLLGPSKMGMTGQNKVWVAGIALMKGVLTDDRELIAKARDAIFEELHVTTKEGIQPDMSFHQHGPQQQWGNYGASFGGDMLQWAAIFKGTDHELSPEQLDLLSRYLLEGSSWIIWKGRMDISGCGRQNFRGCQRDKGQSILRQLKLLNEIASPDPQVYQRIMASNISETPNIFVGNKHFWRSDMTVHRRPSWYASVKMSSTRVIGAETCNSENLKGLHLGDGVTYFHRTGQEYEDLVPVWDWRRLPGTTCRQDSGSLKPGSKRCRGRSDFVGGVSDGVCGVATMEYIRDGLRARKAWFFLEDAMVCLGAGITSEQPESIVTSINQCALRGPVTAGLRENTGRLLAGDLIDGRVDWVHHDGMGYMLMGPEAPQVRIGTQYGNWYDAHHRYSKDVVQRGVFGFWIDHGSHPSDAQYAYAVLPDVTLEDMPGRYASLDVTIVTQSESLLAISSHDGRFVQAVFFEPGRLTCRDDSFIEVDTPCVVMVDRTVKPARLHLADPTHKQKTVTVRLSNRYEKRIDLPTDGLAGRTVNVDVQ